MDELIDPPFILFSFFSSRCRDCVVPRRTDEHGGVQLHQPSPMYRHAGTRPWFFRGHKICGQGTFCCYGHWILVCSSAGASRAREEGDAARADQVSLLMKFLLLIKKKKIWFSGNKTNDYIWTFSRTYPLTNTLVFEHIFCSCVL